MIGVACSVSCVPRSARRRVLVIPNEVRNLLLFFLRGVEKRPSAESRLKYRDVVILRSAFRDEGSQLFGARRCSASVIPGRARNLLLSLVAEVLSNA